MDSVLAPKPSLLDRFRAHLFLRRFRKSSLGQVLAEHSREYFYGDNILSGFSDAAKERLIGDFHLQVFGFAAQPNPHLKFREHLASCVIGYASIQVLCLKPEEKAESFYSGAQYISADLHRHIRACAQHHDELKRIVWEHPDFTDEELIANANARASVWLYYANGLNIVRSEFGEQVIKGRDWYRPSVVSAMIFEEETYRQKIGLPSLAPDTLLPLEHSTFMTGVAGGDRNPLYEWETHYERKHPDSI